NAHVVRGYWLVYVQRLGDRGLLRHLVARRAGKGASPRAFSSGRCGPSGTRHQHRGLTLAAEPLAGKEDEMETALYYLVPAGLVIGSVVFMEWFATWSHRHIMHGWGWGWHKSHHEPHDHALEKNDLYAVVFAGVAILLFLAGEAW